MLESPKREMLDSFKMQASLAANALFGIEDNPSPQLEELARTTQDLCIRAHILWIQWAVDELSRVLSNLRQDDALSATSTLSGWEKIVVKQEQSIEGKSEMEIYLPSVPSLYVTSFLFKACEEIHRVGGHVLDRPILQNFASRLLDKVVGVYTSFFAESQSSQVTEKGILQILLDLRFAADVLSGGDVSTNENPSTVVKMKSSFRRKQDVRQRKSVVKERLDGLINQLSQRLDPIDWLTFEPYLWENAKQSYLRHAVLFGLFVQLNRLYTDMTKKLPTNSESNIMRCSSVPRFKYLPISAPALSSKGAVKLSSTTASIDDVSSRSSWNSYMNGELSRNISLDDNSGLGVAAPLLKSFMQVGSRFGESTLRLGFGDILPAQAAGLLSSFTTSRSDF